MATKKKVTEEIKEEVKAVETKAKKAATAVKKAPAKAKTAAKATTKKVETAVKAEAAKVEKKVAEQKPVAKKVPAAKKALNVVIQSKMGGSITPAEVAAKVPKDAVNAYVKVEENKIYWTSDKDAGSVDIW
jgi:hypothetical protein